MIDDFWWHLTWRYSHLSALCDQVTGVDPLPWLWNWGRVCGHQLLPWHQLTHHSTWYRISKDFDAKREVVLNWRFNLPSVSSTKRFTGSHLAIKTKQLPPAWPIQQNKAGAQRCFISNLRSSMSYQGFMLHPPTFTREQLWKSVSNGVFVLHRCQAHAVSILLLRNVCLILKKKCSIACSHLIVFHVSLQVNHKFPSADTTQFDGLHFSPFGSEHQRSQPSRIASKPTKFSKCLL